jgi:hypothetical protein
VLARVADFQTIIINKTMGSILSYFTSDFILFYLPNISIRTMALELTQPLAEMSTGNLSVG